MLPSSCESFLRVEGVNAQTDESPFQIVTATTSAVGGEIIEIAIQADYGRSFRGFFLVAEMSHVHDLGEFLFSDEETQFKFRDCGRGFHNAVSEANSEDHLQNISFYWLVPENYDGTVRFR